METAKASSFNDKSQFPPHKKQPAGWQAVFRITLM